MRSGLVHRAIIARSAPTRAAGRPGPGLLLGVAAAFTGPFALVALSPVYAVTAGLLVLLGMAGVAFSTTINTSLQVIVPDDLRGR